MEEQRARASQGGAGAPGLLRRMSRRSLLGLLLLAGCAGSPPPVADVRLAAPAPRRGMEPLEIAGAVGGGAPWLAAFSPRPVTTAPEVATLAVSHDAALGRVEAGVYALHHKLGVVGPLAVGEGDWVGLDERSRVLLARPDGTLLRAPDVQAARRAEGFAQLAAIPGALAWDASGEWIAVATKAKVLLSGDGGRAFRVVGALAGNPFVDERHLVGRSREAAVGWRMAVLVRADGAVAAQTYKGAVIPTWLAAPGKPLSRPRIDLPPLARVGGWIGAGEPCAVALSTDGVRFASLARWIGPEERSEWTRALLPTAEVVASTRDFVESPGEPPPPSPPASQVDWTGCGLGVPQLSHLLPSAPGPAAPSVPACSGAGAVSGVLDEEPTPAAKAVALFGDGLCAPTDEDPDAPGACRAGAPLRRLPGVALIDREADTVSVGALPPGCTPQKLLTAGGVGVLVCEPLAAPEEAPIFLADVSGRWQSEGTLRLGGRRVDALRLAPDGTLLLRAGWSDPETRRAFVRRPLALGDPRAFREVDVRGAAEVRVDVGGGLLLILPGGTPAPSFVALALDTPAAPRRTLVERAVVAGALVDVAIVGRRVAFFSAQGPHPSACELRRGGEGRDALVKSWVAGSGALLPVL